MKFITIEHDVDFCVIGGGMAGVVAAIAAARHGARVVLMNDRPVLGGNSSSECRVGVSGADFNNKNKHMRETGILEEFRLESLYRNPAQSCANIWDLILYQAVMAEKNIIMLQNCTCQDAEMDGVAILSVTGWQLTTQTNHQVRARIFADCSGDAILAPLTGADFRVGREARSEFGESIAPEVADKRTMGMTCLFKTRETAFPEPFHAPDRIYKYESCDDLPYGAKGHKEWGTGYWWIELGGEQDSIVDTEKIRDELLKVTLGVWDHVRNRCPHCKGAERWALDWVQFLPGKRESRRYEGEYMLTQNDIMAGGRFDDVVAYGGWKMDDHHPAGFNAVQIHAPATIFHPAPSPYGIPYRCFYSRNISNLMFAGRDASCTHAAMSSTRVMATGAVMGQAVGTAAALAISKGIRPADVKGHIHELQQKLILDDAYIPWIQREVSAVTRESQLEASQGDPEPVRDGIYRQVGSVPHAWHCQPGDWVAYTFGKAVEVERVTLALDSGLDENITFGAGRLMTLPAMMPESFKVEGLRDGVWHVILKVTGNRQRLVRVPVAGCLEGVRYTLEKTYGAGESRVYGFRVE